jgi:hypothetical protein
MYRRVVMVADWAGLCPALGGEQGRRIDLVQGRPIRQFFPIQKGRPAQILLPSTKSSISASQRREMTRI